MPVFRRIMAEGVVVMQDVSGLCSNNSRVDLTGLTIRSDQTVRHH